MVARTIYTLVLGIKYYEVLLPYLKIAIFVSPGGTTKLLPRFIGPFTLVEEVRDLSYRLTLPPYMKTHPVFYVGRLKRYVDPQEIPYPHRSNETDGDADRESSVVAEEATGKTDSFPASSDPHLATDLESEEDSAQGAGLSLSNAPRSPNEVSAGCNPGDSSREHRAVPKSVVRLDSRDPKSVARLDS